MNYNDLINKWRQEPLEGFTKVKDSIILIDTNKKYRLHANYDYFISCWSNGKRIFIIFIKPNALQIPLI